MGRLRKLAGRGKMSETQFTRRKKREDIKKQSRKQNRRK